MKPAGSPGGCCWESEWNLPALTDVLPKQLPWAGVTAGWAAGQGLPKPLLFLPTGGMCCSRRGCWLGTAQCLQEPVAQRSLACMITPHAGRDGCWRGGGVAPHGHDGIWARDRSKARNNVNHENLNIPSVFLITLFPLKKILYSWDPSGRLVQS